MDATETDISQVTRTRLSSTRPGVIRYGSGV